MRPKMLFVGDAAVPSGFGKASDAYLDGVKDDYDLTVLGMNYRGDPHDYPYPIYAAAPGGDAFGIGRLLFMCDLVTATEQRGQRREFLPVDQHRKPDVIVIQNDPWNFPYYFKQLKLKNKEGVAEYADIPVVGIVAVDGKNCRGTLLNDLTHAIFWTQFGLDEARAGGFTKPASVMPLGVDLVKFAPRDKIAARRRRGLPPSMDHSFIVGNVNRNQPRKRWDLTLKYFAEFVHSGVLKDAYLYLHVAPTGDNGVDVLQMAVYLGIANRLALIEPMTFYGVDEDVLCDTYNCFDVQVNTGQGEGFGLTTIEGMACGTPQMAGDWAGLGDWAKGAACLVPCPTTAINSLAPSINTIGGVPDEAAFVRELNALHGSAGQRSFFTYKGIDRVSQHRFRWSSVGGHFRSVLYEVLCATKEAVG